MDKLFKIGILVIGIAFVTVLFFYSQNGRYHLYSDEDSYKILDTRTGNVVLVANGKQMVTININDSKIVFTNLKRFKTKE